MIENVVLDASHDLKYYHMIFTLSVCQLDRGIHFHTYTDQPIASIQWYANCIIAWYMNLEVQGKGLRLQGC